MKNLFLIILITCATATIGFAQAHKYAPFEMDTSTVTATIKVGEAALSKKFTAVFTKHKMNVALASDWQAVMEQIVGMKETDLYSSGDINFDVDDEGFVVVGAVSMPQLQKAVKVLRSFLNSSEKLDAFLNDQERLLKKKDNTDD